MARRRTPASRYAAACTYAGPGPEDLLENKLEQLNSLLWCCHGGGDRWCNDAEGIRLNNALWLAYELAREGREFFHHSKLR